MTTLLSPMTGTVLPLDKVPDNAFSRKLLGDGVALLPEDGRLCAPADGVLSAVAHTLHAYIFTTDDGLEILVHVGLESVGLQGRGFRPLVTAGQRVRAGQTVAEVDLLFLRRKGVPLYTPVVICEGGMGRTLTALLGKAEAGSTPLIQID